MKKSSFKRTSRRKASRNKSSRKFASQPSNTLSRPINMCNTLTTTISTAYDYTPSTDTSTNSNVLTTDTIANQISNTLGSIDASRFEFQVLKVRWFGISYYSRKIVAFPVDMRSNASVSTSSVSTAVEIPKLFFRAVDVAAVGTNLWGYQTISSTAAITGFPNIQPVAQAPAYNIFFTNPKSNRVWLAHSRSNTGFDNQYVTGIMTAPVVGAPASGFGGLSVHCDVTCKVRIIPPSNAAATKTLGASGSSPYVSFYDTEFTSEIGSPAPDLMVKDSVIPTDTSSV